MSTNRIDLGAHGAQQTLERRRRSPEYAWISLLLLGAASEVLGRLLPGGVARALFEIPPVLLLPGFAIIVLLFGRSRPRDLTTVLIFSIVLSLAVLIADGLLLNAAGIRLSSTSLALSDFLVMSAFFGLIVAAGRVIPYPHLNRESSARWSSRRSFTVRGIAFALSIAICLGCVSFVATRLPARKPVSFTALSLGASWATRSTAREVSTGQIVTIPLVITSEATSKRTYTLFTTVDGAQVATRSILLAPNDKWTGSVKLTAPAGNALHRVVITLENGISKNLDQLTVYLDNHAS